MTSRVCENLISIAWRSVPVHQIDMERFFQQLEKPLQFMCLSGLHLLSGSWAEMLELLQAAYKGSYHVTFSNPRGAECDELISEEVATIFKPPRDDPWSKSQAELYILGYVRQNPLKAVEDDPNDTSSSSQP